MQTTLRLDDDLLRRVKVRAATRGISMTRFIEEAIREHLEAPRSPAGVRRLRLPVSTATGGLAPGFTTLEDAVAAAGLEDDRRAAGDRAHGR